MKITIAICTWNRSDLLTKTLENMLQLKADESFSWELIIVNNNCTDDTDQVITQFSDRLPIKRVSEPTPGLSNARNAAVRNATGDYIIWTDDDVLVDENWLIAYVEAFIKYPEAAVFGGPVEPWFEGEPPRWIIQGWEHVASSYAVRDLGNSEICLQQKGNIIPYGANFAVRLKEQVENLYDPRLGLVGDKRIMGEEVAVLRQILSVAGAVGWWLPKAKVKHWLPKERQSLQYIKKYYVGHGETRKRRKTNVLNNKKNLFGRPRKLYRKLIIGCSQYAVQRIFCDAKVWLRTYVEICILWGKFKK